MPQRPSLAPLALVALSALALTGCAAAAPAATEAPTTAPSANTPEPTTSASSAPEPAATESSDEIDTSDWLEHTTEVGALTLRYPPTWDLEASSEVGPPEGRTYDTLVLRNQAGETMLTVEDFADIGGALSEWPGCEVFEREPANLTWDGGATSIVSAAVQFHDGTWVLGVGITGDDALQFGCPHYFSAASSEGGVFVGSHTYLNMDDPAWVVGSLEEARERVASEEHRTIVEVLRSVHTA